MIDLLLVHRDEGQLQISTIFNNIDRTAFFLKAKMMSDVQHSITGASFRAVLTDTKDQKFIVTAGASGQTGFHSLQTPYSSIGIGKSNNYVEIFTVGVYVEGRRVLREWSPIIPKSNLIVIADKVNRFDESKWSLSLLVKPTDKIPLILVFDGIFLLCLGLVIIVLHLSEKA